MQDNVKQLYIAISHIIDRTRKERGINYTDFCLGNDIPTSTYDDIINASRQSSFYNIAKVVKALDLSFEEFGKLLDKELPDNFMKEDI